MASLQPPPAFVAKSRSSSAAAYCSPYSFKSSSQILITRNPKRHLKVSCKGQNGEQNPNQSRGGKFDRRDVLLGLGGLYGATSLVSDPLAFAAPISAPDLTKCGAADFPQGVAQINCCPPPSTKILDFKPPAVNAMRVRPAAHLVNKDYVDKFNKAIELMKALPDSDPRSFRQQANIHCAYCDGAYDQVGFPDLELQVHDSWLFFPFHRHYLYFFEKILGKLIDDPNFAMPFWNWDTSAGMPMPSIYAVKSSPLYDAIRNARHQPPSLVDLDFSGQDNASNNQRIQTNLTVMYRTMVSGATTSRLFLGNPYRAGQPPNPGAGSLENAPHGAVHVWTGDPTHGGEDMGNFYSAARDPIFYAHHSNVDRMWSVWKTLGGRRQDFTDPDWLDTGFLFYNENAELVRVKIRDCLDTKSLGYVYQDVPTPWLSTRPTPRLARVARRIKSLVTANAADAPFAKDVFPTVLDKVIKVMVPRPKKTRSKKEKADKEETLVIEGIEVKREQFVKFDVFINDEDEATSGADKTEFAGTFVNVPHQHHHKLGKKVTKTSQRFGLNELLEDLGAEDDENVLVTLVPRQGRGDVKIGSIKIALED